jgi:hypothetical protein
MFLMVNHLLGADPPLSSTKWQVEAIVIYVAVAILISAAIFLALFCCRRRRKAKLHDASVVERAVESDSD